MTRFETQASALCPYFGTHGASVCCQTCRSIATALKEAHQEGYEKADEKRRANLPVVGPGSIDE